MVWTYDVRKVTFTRNNDEKFNARYAGTGKYKNNPDYECLKNKGPLPRGSYTISKPIARHPTAGPYVLRLTPDAGNNMCKRSGFLIHGDNSTQTASTGCIILIYEYRRKIAHSGDNRLVVV